MLLGMPACADDIPEVPPDTETGTSTTAGTTLPPIGTSTSTSGVDTTETASTTVDVDSTSSSSSSGSSSSGETESTTEEPPVQTGQTVHQIVSAGTRTASRSYTLVHTLGQPSPLQSTHQSTSYRLQGGLVGANGSPP